MVVCGSGSGWRLTPQAIHHCTHVFWLLLPSYPHHHAPKFQDSWTDMPSSLGGDVLTGLNPTALFVYCVVLAL